MAAPRRAPRRDPAPGRAANGPLPLRALPATQLLSTRRRPSALRTTLVRAFALHAQPILLQIFILFFSFYFFFLMGDGVLF